MMSNQPTGEDANMTMADQVAALVTFKAFSAGVPAENIVLAQHMIEVSADGTSLHMRCPCGGLDHHETYRFGAAPSDPDNVVAVMSRCADAGRDHIVDESNKLAAEPRPGDSPPDGPIGRRARMAYLQVLERRARAGTELTDDEKRFVYAENQASTEPIGHHRMMAMTDDQLRDAYRDTVEFGREAGNQPPIYRRLQDLAGELERRGLERPVVPS